MFGMVKQHIMGWWRWTPPAATYCDNVNIWTLLCFLFWFCDCYYRKNFLKRASAWIQLEARSAFASWREEVENETRLMHWQRFSDTFCSVTIFAAREAKKPRSHITQPGCLHLRRLTHIPQWMTLMPRTMKHLRVFQVMVITRKDCKHRRQLAISHHNHLRAVVWLYRL